MTTSGKDNSIPGAVVSRLTKYLTHAQVLRGEGVQWVSSSELGEELGLTSATVRKDLAHVSVGGITNRGYEVTVLCDALLSFLGVDVGWNAIVVGAGNLGKALALHGELFRHGFAICGVFDSDGRKVGMRVGGLTVRPMSELAATIHDERVDIGVIAVPAAAAQSVADLLIISGIRGLLNLSLIHIVAPSNVPVVDGRLVARMLELGHAVRTSAARGDTSDYRLGRVGRSEDA
ncbi:MAG: redox-sensing transcriptional repressor Rex [Lentisphaerae bacterium]|nr:redox-sensing transcriptional repressor Rex [Lentisphaerota bacterium]